MANDKIKQYLIIDDEWYERLNYEPCPKCKEDITKCLCRKQYLVDVYKGEQIAFHPVSDYRKFKKE